MKLHVNSSIYDIKSIYMCIDVKYITLIISCIKHNTQWYIYPWSHKNSHFSDLQRLLKNGQKPDSFASPFVQYFNNTKSRTYICKYMTFKVIKQLNPIDAMKTYTKPNCNICMQERLTILKKLRDKHVTVMNKNSEIYGACRHKMTFHRFCLSTDDPVFNGWRGTVEIQKNNGQSFIWSPTSIQEQTKIWLIWCSLWTSL